MTLTTALSEPMPPAATPLAGCFEVDGNIVCPVTSSSLELAKDMPVERVKASVAIRDWLLTEARQSRDPGLILAGLSERLNFAGVPVDRSSIAMETLHAEHAAFARTWLKDDGGVTAEAFAYQRGRDENEKYLSSPFFVVHQTREHLLLDLAQTPDDAYGIVPGLKAAGFLHYLCFPIFFANGDENGITFATRAPQGFSQDDIAFIRFLMPAVAAVLELVASYITLDQVLRIYIGNEPHKFVLEGDVRRGNVSRIRSAILFADMRGYTHLSSDMTPEETVELLNVFFDCLVPPIEAEGGEVLKYMGDGLLAIFRDRGDDTGAAAQAALSAAQTALAAIEATLLPRPISAGIALHYGEAAYGNVGSGARLDFTVVGRDVNLASRLASMNKVLGEPLLMSGAFADHLWGDPKPLGSHVLDGLQGEVAVFKP
jgi:adenylate cyclase